jgi:superfamily I DNA and RNA helicase
VQDAIKRIGVTGTLYIGYPVLATADAKVFVDALLVSRDCGIIAFDLASDVSRLSDAQKDAVRERQDQIFAAIYNKLNSYRELRKSRRLAVDVSVITCDPRISDVIREEGLIISPPSKLADLFRNFGEVPDDIFRIANAALQRVSTLRPPKKREDVAKEGSRGAVLKRIEKEIANLDRWQNQGAIEYTNGPQRIRGLAGSGKTVVLALKASYLHARHPEWTIVVTFNTRSLYQQFRDLIRRFTFDQIEDDPDWSKLLIMHAWGSPRDAGVYSTVCQFYDIAPSDWRTAERKYPNRAFEGICGEVNTAIAEQGKKKLFDVVLVDEAQDLPTPFFRMIYSVVGPPHRIIWAYDDLQNLGDYVMTSEQELFGSDRHGAPLVTLRNQPDQPQEDIVLPVCYRNTPWALAAAHALGFGIYRPEGLVQMFEEPKIWPRIGYEKVRGHLELGAHIRVRRRPDSYPRYFNELLAPGDAIRAKAFGSEDEQYAYLSADIRKNLVEDELEHTDILIVVPDAWTAKKIGGRIMNALIKNKIMSHLVGVTTSRDEIFKNGSIAITHIHRAKGNEAPMVYLVNADYCQTGFELSRKRNILFTGITRSRCWVRILGVGPRMEALAAELEAVRRENFELDFEYPDQQEIKKLARVHRDMTVEEREGWEQKLGILQEVARAVAEGEVPLEAIPVELRDLFAANGKKRGGRAAE